MNLVAECNLSFNIIQNEAFRSLLELTAGREVSIPTARDIMNTLSEHSEMLKTKLIEKIAKQRYVCLTCDIWSSRAQSYFSMTVHFINPEFQRESYVLAFRAMNHKQTNKEITQMIRQILREFKISPEKVTHIVTDGGSAFCKAFKLYGTSVDILVEQISDEQEVDDDMDEVNEMPFMQSEDGETFYSNIIDFDTDYDDNNLYNFELNDFDQLNDFEFTTNDEHSTSDEISETNQNNSETYPNDEYEKELPRHRRCLSHLLNLLGNDFESSLEAVPKELLMATFNKLQAIWVFPRKSTQAKRLSKKFLDAHCLFHAQPDGTLNTTPF